MCVGCGTPAATRIVGPLFLTCVNWERSPPGSRIPRGRWATHRARGRPPGGGAAPPTFGPAPLEQARALLLIGQRDAVHHRGFVKRAREGAPEARAVVTPDVD